jgi:preprotein translocase subunit SecG
MFSLESVVIVFHLLGAIGIVLFVLLQQGKGAEAGASFGSGASGTVFGSQGSTTFLSRITAILATAFFITSLGLAYFAKQKAQGWEEAGLPNPAVLEVQQGKPVVEDVPVLEERAPASEGDVPAAPAQ